MLRAIASSVAIISTDSASVLPFHGSRPGRTARTKRSVSARRPLSPGSTMVSRGVVDGTPRRR
ncbi:hypothetical protein DIE08_05385 [Burkholderia sp. Bp9004]|nr:hypothetical protein DIE08_05385 [Burkholderia sp. Bp9004]